MRKRGRRMLAILVVTAVACMVAATAEAGSSGTPVLVGPQRDVYPAATPGETFLGFSRNADGMPNHFDAYVKKPGLPPVKVNPRGQGFAGGFDGSTFVYQALYRGSSNLRLFNAASGVFLPNPSAKVNTDQWEWRPTISGDHLLFARFNPTAAGITDRIVLANTRTDEVKLIDKQERNKPRYLVAGQVNGDWAVWESHVAQTQKLNVRLYRISTSSRLILPLPAGRVQYSPSVNSTGDVFYVRSRPGCGVSVVIRRNDRSGTDSLVTTIPSGSDVFKTYAVNQPGGGVAVYYDVYKCSTGAIDIYKVTVP
jgi:hypothetical protein